LIAIYYLADLYNRENYSKEILLNTWQILRKIVEGYERGIRHLFFNNMKKNCKHNKPVDIKIGKLS